jgi:hypothetical protein
MGPVRALHQTRCVYCTDPIRRGDPIVFALDDLGWCHVSCEPSPGPWEMKTPANPLLLFHDLLKIRPTLTQLLLDAEIDLNALPAAVQEKFDGCGGTVVLAAG